MNEVEAKARKVADEVLFPAALKTDAMDVLPLSNLDALADAGFYGLFLPPESGGLGADFPTMCSAIEILAGGCLTTTLVWVQHFGFVGSLLGGPEPLRDAWLEDACRGRRRGGIAFGGLLPGPPVLTATPDDDGGGWRLNGFAPWVSGWGRIDVLRVAARGPDETIVNVALDAIKGDGLSVTPRRLAAVNASSTVRVDFDDVRLPGERVFGVVPFDPNASAGESLRLNGSLALGVARKCCELLGSSAFDDELASRRAGLDGADGDAMAGERARASEFAVRAAAAVVVAQGSSSLVVDQHAQRLLREAMFLLVFGSRAEIKHALLNLLAPSG